MRRPVRARQISAGQDEAGAGQAEAGHRTEHACWVGRGAEVQPREGKRELLPQLASRPTDAPECRHQELDES